MSHDPTTVQQRAASLMSEADLQSCVTDLALALGYMVLHIRDSRGQDVEGFPDWFLLPTNPPGPPIYAELKDARGKLTEGRFDLHRGSRGAWIRGQTEWRDALLAAGQRWVLWRPADWLSGEIERVLKGER